MKTKKSTVVILIILVLLLTLIPLFVHKGAEFEGSDSAGSEMIEKISGDDYKPWFTPLIETLIGGELSSEMETLFFSLQTGIGVGVLAYCFGYLAARKKYSASIP